MIRPTCLTLIALALTVPLLLISANGCRGKGKGNAKRQTDPSLRVHESPAKPVENARSGRVTLRDTPGEHLDVLVGGQSAEAPKTAVLPAEQPKRKAPATQQTPEGGQPQAAVVETREPSALATTAPTTQPATGPVAKKKPKTNRPGPADAPLVFNPPPPEPLGVAEALKTFALPDGLAIEAVASEPMVEEPVAISFDEKGRMYVVEMRGYMLDVDASGEDDPIGRVKRLDDTDGDGVFDRATVFLDNLVMPRAVMAYRNGAIVGVPPVLAYWEDANDDGVADKQTVIATNYGTAGGQPEHMANTPMYALDNWIYSAGHEVKYREQRGIWTSVPTPKRGQYGLAQDDFGRLYFSTNSDVGRAEPLPAEYFSRTPYYRARAGQNIGLMDTQAVWPSHPTPGVNRGYEKEQLRPDGTLATATAAGGATVYRGDLLPPEFVGNLFTPEPSGNLIKRMIVTDASGKLAARNAYENQDFLTSSDERFRPVFMTTGPDGSLYVVDMYKGVLQHYYYLTHYLIKNIKARGLETPNHWGRIYRIVPKGATPTAAKLRSVTADLVASLEHSNGWVRDTAQRLLVQANDKGAVPPLKKLVREGKTPLGRLHALWTLEGMGRLDEVTTRRALSDSHPKVRAAAVRLFEPLLNPTTRAQSQASLMKLVGDPAPEVQLQLVLSLGPIPDEPVFDMVANFLTASAADPDLMRDAAMSSLRGRELEMAERLIARADWASESPDKATTLTELARAVMAEHRSARVGRLAELASKEPEGSWRQVALLTGMVPAKANLATTMPTTIPASVVGKLIYLDGPPDGLPSLLASNDAKVQSLARWADARLAWPGKPGVPPPPTVTPLTPEEQTRFDHGKQVYAQLCAVCHQPSGLGQEGLAPPLVDSEWVLGPPERIVRIILQGLTGPITVNGVPYKLEMPALATMSDADIAAVITYIRREPDWEHTASPVDAAMVAKVREATKDRTDLWTGPELMQVK